MDAHLDRRGLASINWGTSLPLAQGIAFDL